MSNTKITNLLPGALKYLRKENNVTQVKISEIIDRPIKRYQKWEEGRSTPDLISLFLIARAHGITMDSLMSLAFSIGEKNGEVMPDVFKVKNCA